MLSYKEYGLFFVAVGSVMADNDCDANVACGEHRQALMDSLVSNGVDVTRAAEIACTHFNTAAYDSIKDNSDKFPEAE